MKDNCDCDAMPEDYGLKIERLVRVGEQDSFVCSFKYWKYCHIKLKKPATKKEIKMLCSEIKKALLKDIQGMLNKQDISI